MSNPVFTKFYSFTEAMAEKKHDLGADTLKVVLSNVAPSLSNTQLSDITQIANGNGYTTGGSALTTTTSAQSSGVYYYIASQLVFTSSGAGMATFRYAIVYNDTATNDLLIGYIDYGYGISVAVGATYTFAIDQTNGLFTVS